MAFKEEELEALDYAGRIRKDIIMKFTAGGIPDDLGVADFLLGAIKDHEDVQIKKARVRQADKDADASAAEMNILKSIMIEMGNVSTDNAIPIINKDPVVLTIPKQHKTDTIEGESDISHKSISYDELMSDEPSEIVLQPPED